MAELLPENVLIVANRAVPESMELARYYSQRRQIPPQNLVQVETSRDEHVSREAYEKEIAAPVRAREGREMQEQPAGALLKSGL